MENNIVKQEDQQIVQQEFDTLSFALSLVSWIPDTFRKITKSEDDIDFVYFYHRSVNGIINYKKEKHEN